MKLGAWHSDVPPCRGVGTLCRSIEDQASQLRGSPVAGSL
jgi:hypothetical protein